MTYTVAYQNVFQTSWKRIHHFYSSSGIQIYFDPARKIRRPLKAFETNTNRGIDIYKQYFSSFSRRKNIYIRSTHGTWLEVVFRHYQRLAHTVKVMTTIMRYKTRGVNEKPLQLAREHRKVKSIWTISKTVDRRPESRCDIATTHTNNKKI